MVAVITYGHPNNLTLEMISVLTSYHSCQLGHRCSQLLSSKYSG